MTKLNKLDTINAKIAQLENQRKQEIQKQKQAERKARTKHLCSRMGHIESVLPDTINLTDEQFQVFIKRTLQNDHARKMLCQTQALASGENTAKSPQNEPRQSITAAPSSEGGAARSGKE